MHVISANHLRWSRHARLAGGVAAIALALTACAAPADSTGPSAPARHGCVCRGAVVSVVPVASFPAPTLAAALKSLGLGPWSTLVQYGVDGYRVLYRTISVDGSPTTASGLIVLPRRPARSLRVVEFGHGTQVPRRNAPSFNPESDGWLAGLVAASAGFAAVAPDYLGLGAGPGPHPFLHAASEASASLDLLRASLAIAARHGRRLDPRVLLTGFSQGGQAAMALGQALQDGADPRLRLGALAPVSGTYDIAHAELPATFSGRITPKSATYYLPYLLLAWNRIYHLFQRPAQAFRAPYDHTMPVLYDGYHTDNQITAGLAPSLRALLTPRFLRLLHHPAGALLRGLRINDATCDWHPDVPIRLYAARGDRDSVLANAWHCQAALAAHGARVPVIDVGPVDHDTSLVLALPQLLAWFQQLNSSRVLPLVDWFGGDGCGGSGWVCWAAGQASWSVPEEGLPWRSPSPGSPIRVSCRTWPVSGRSPVRAFRTARRRGEPLALDPGRLAGTGRAQPLPPPRAAQSNPAQPLLAQVASSVEPRRSTANRAPS